MTLGSGWWSKNGVPMLGFSGDATLFFDEHVEADAVHESIAAVDLAGGLVQQDPRMYDWIVWGAEVASHVAECWEARQGDIRARRRRLSSWHRWTCAGGQVNDGPRGLLGAPTTREDS